MARTKQTARKSTNGKAPRKQLASRHFGWEPHKTLSKKNIPEIMKSVIEGSYRYKLILFIECDIILITIAIFVELK